MYTISPLSVTVKGYRKNPVRQIDMIAGAFHKFQVTGRLLLPEQESIYRKIAERTDGKKIVEYGCGIGLGTNILSRTCSVWGTDSQENHIRFASMIFLLPFDVWDMEDGPFSKAPADIAVAVEVIEHVEHPEKALETLLTAPECYFSTPNRNHPSLGKDRPWHDYHVQEFTPGEILSVIPEGRTVEILHPFTFEKLNPDTEISPLVFHCPSAL